MAPNDLLWKSLSTVAFDDPDAAFDFTARLARDNGWSRSFAARVIEEYRRFAYLAMTSGHEVTPSDEVDQAWHLHLTFTRHYWGVFTEALGAPLHHNPTAGGAGERARYADNYARTLASYERIFGAAAPADIWPPAHIRFGDAPFMQRVNRRREFVVSKRRVFVGAGAAAGVTTLMASVAAQDITGGASGIIDAFNNNPVIGFGIVAVVIMLILMAFGKGRRGRRDKGAGDGGGGAGAGAAGGKSGKGDADGDGGCSGCGGGCGGG